MDSALEPEVEPEVDTALSVESLYSFKAAAAPAGRLYRTEIANRRGEHLGTGGGRGRAVLATGTATTCVVHAYQKEASHALQSPVSHSGQLELELL